MRDNHSFDDKNILIVDDNQTNVLLLQSILEDYGYKHISTAQSAKEAYELLESKKIDLILLDVMMPDIDGIEACRTIKEMPKYKYIPIIMVTADSSDETLKKSFDAGADDFTTKPINFINLNSRIQNVFIHKEKDELILNQTRSAAINDIIDTLAHQWRQPLSAISASAMSIGISYEFDELDEKSLTKYLDDITSYTQKLSKTIDDIRNISKVDSRVLDTYVNKLIQDVIDLIQLGYENDKISIEVQKQELKYILTYPNELTSVLLNILINSQEAFIRNEINDERVVKVKISQDDTHTSISIKDNAGGIDSEILSKVFDPYFSTKYEKNEKGLGLHNCKQIIQFHLGGEINISSKDGNTEVTINLLNKNKDLT